jgi:hypothetical protein
VGADEFIVGSELDGFRYFFEQDGRTGYLYVGTLSEITHHLHVYNRSPNLHITEQDVKVILNRDRTRCGVVIFGKLRAVLGFNGDAFRPAYAMEGEGVTDPSWAADFDLLSGL